MKPIIITKKYFGGAKGVKMILNNHYEDALQVFSTEDQVKIRKFIEEECSDPDRDSDLHSPKAGEVLP